MWLVRWSYPVRSRCRKVADPVQFAWVGTPTRSRRRRCRVSARGGKSIDQPEVTEINLPICYNGTERPGTKVVVVVRLPESACSGYDRSEGVSGHELNPGPGTPSRTTSASRLAKRATLGVDRLGPGVGLLDND